jgi:hypothetical protein
MMMMHSGGGLRGSDIRFSCCLVGVGSTCQLSWHCWETMETNKSISNEMGVLRHASRNS